MKSPEYSSLIDSIKRLSICFLMSFTVINLVKRIPNFKLCCKDYNGVLYINFNTHVVQSCPAESINAADKVTCSNNVAYDTVSNALKMSSQAKVSTSENIAYATVRDEVGEYKQMHVHKS